MYPGPSYLGSEDFAFMLQKKKGTYCLLGNGDTAMVHHPQTSSTTRFCPWGPHTGSRYGSIFMPTSRSDSTTLGVRTSRLVHDS